LIGWYDPSDSTNCIVSANNFKGNDITLTNKVKEKIGNLTTKSGTKVKSNLISTSDTNLLNNLSQYNLLRIYNRNDNIINNSYLSVSTDEYITNSFTIFIIYNSTVNNPPVDGIIQTLNRASLFNTSDGTSNIIGMITYHKMIGSYIPPSSSSITYDNTVVNNDILGGDKNRLLVGFRNSCGDESYLSLYTAIVEIKDTKVTWIEHVYNKFKNMTSIYSKINASIKKLCTILNICGSISNLTIGSLPPLNTGFDGYLGEILLYNTALIPTNTTNNKNTPTSQYDNTVKYLRNKWNI
jgi:hypothetical protein